ncbi:MAG: YbjQ family protein [Pseudomonadota bacterium]
MRHQGFPVATSDTLPGYEIERSLGIARGTVVRTRHVGADITAALRNIVGGEVPEYTKMMAGAREQAMDRMIEQAREMGADGIVAMRFASATVMQGSSEILAYGTAVTLRPPG